jgi:hypothetical protein
MWAKGERRVSGKNLVDPVVLGQMLVKLEIGLIVDFNLRRAAVLEEGGTGTDSEESVWEVRLSGSNNVVVI